MKKTKEIIAEIISPNGPFPNNSQLPLLIYKGALPSSDNMAQTVQELFQQNGWKRAWVDSIYPYHHYHSNTHEVLGVISGNCEVEIGRNEGHRFSLEKGDVLIIPAGVSHKKITCSHDFECVGAYPFDIEYDMNYGKPEEEFKAKERIKKVGLPKADPVYGTDGPLFNYWH